MTKRSPNGSRSSKKSSGSTYKKVGKIVNILWEDAYKETSWVRQPHEHEALLVNDVGHVIFHDKRGIMIATSRAKDGTFGGRTFIPSGMIRKIKVLNND